MNPDGTHDKNLIDVDPAQSGTADNQTVLYLGTVDASAKDNAGRSIYTGTIKITNHCHNITVNATIATGGSENIVDENNECFGNRVVLTHGVIAGKYGISSKTCKYSHFSGHLVGSPSQWHINLGSWSDQSKAVQEHTTLVLTADSYPILVWSGNARNTILDDPKKYKFVFKVWFCDVPYLGRVTLAIFLFGWSIAKLLKLKNV